MVLFFYLTGCIRSAIIKRKMRVFIMGQKSKLTGNRKFSFIRKELLKLYGDDTMKRIISLAENYYDNCEALCKNATQGEWQHLNGTILPTVAIYKALQEIDPDHALSHAHTIMMRMCKMGGNAIGMVLKFPGMKRVFMWLLPRMATRIFGPSCGFQYTNYEVSKTFLKMDMTDCPYCRYAKLLGCPELMRVFCDSDFATYGDLPGIRFERTQTLGTGGNCCDFKFTKVVKENTYEA